jgi:hypothetical protein
MYPLVCSEHSFYCDKFKVQFRIVDKLVLPPDLFS